jgi:RpiR family transcriptional regulator, carbohydrate utilization regulator
VTAPPLQILAGEVAARLRATSASMQTSERRVMDVVIQNPQMVVDSSVSEVARAARSAPSTVIRMCKRACYSGFHELKLRLVADLATHRSTALDHGEGLSALSTPDELVTRVLWLSSRTIESAGALLDRGAFDEAVQRLSGANRVLVVGNGTSMAPAQDAAYRFVLLGLDAVAPPDSYSQANIARQLGPQDACVVISHTGSTRDSLTAATAAKEAGAWIVLISSYGQSPISEVTDSVLLAGGHEQGFQLEAMSSRLAHLAVVDALFVGIALTDDERSKANLERMARVTAERSF